MKTFLHICSYAQKVHLCAGILLAFILSIPAHANPDYVKITALKDASGVEVINSYRDPATNLYYSTDNGATWKNASPNTSTVSIALSKDEFVLFRGTNPNGLNTPGSGSRAYVTLKMTIGQLEVSGDIMSLVDYSSNMVDLVPGDGCFYRLFQGSTTLVSAKNLKLSAKYTSKASYNEMFNGCTALTDGPDMTNIECIEEVACQKMFYNCKKLTQTCNMPNLVTINTNGCNCMYQNCTALTFAHDLIAKYVDNYSYSAMFNSCTALKTAPRIDAYEMRLGTCLGMFKGCSVLESSPDLNAQFLDSRCYESMFEDCKALKKAPVLKATSLYYEYGNKKETYTSCYKWMFKGCTALREIEVYFSDWRYVDPGAPTGVWIQNVIETTDAVFKCPCGLPEKRGLNCYIPNKWQRECFNFYLFDVYTNDAVWADDHKDYNNRALKESEISAIPQAYKEKHKFIGWNTKPDGTGTAFSMSDKPDTTTTYYAIFESLVPVEPEVNCINYSDLTAANVRCDTSALDAKNFKWYNWVENRRIDYGSRNRMSQHTTHHHPAEVDIRTDGKLHTACPNGKPSVRLGNWNKKQRERITYTYTVPDDENAKILLLYYAAVLENPENHKTEEQPRFMLELFEEGKTIESCFQFDYISGDISTDPTWHTERGNLCWKDWTTSGINLEAYKGKTIKIQITTFDCAQGGHFGYAYFGLECSNGELKTISCGDQKEFKAPDGFNYAWFEESKPGTILSNEQIFPLPQDKPGTYWCKVSNPEHPEPECTFDLKAVVEERSAIAEFDTLTRVIEGKNNIFYVTNTSHTTDNDLPDSCAWTLRDAHNNIVSVSDELTPSFTIDKSGTYTLTLVAYLKGKDIECPSAPVVKNIVVGAKGAYLEIPQDTILCGTDAFLGWKGHPKAIKINETTYQDTVFSSSTPKDTTVYILNITRQIATSAKVETDNIVKGQTYTWRGKDYKATSLETIHAYDTTHYPISNCDSVYYELELIITEHPVVSTEATICANEPYTWIGHETKYTNVKKAGVYMDTIVSPLGDSTFYLLNLSVNDTFAIEDPITCYASDFPFTWNGFTINSKEDNGKVWNGKTMDGCDSIVTLNLEIGCRKLNATLVIDTLCANQTEMYGMLTVNAGKAVSYSVTYKQTDPNGHFKDVQNMPLRGMATEQLIIPFERVMDTTKYIRPDNYDLTITVMDTCGSTQDFSVSAVVLYPSWIILQRWNDVLALYNSKYNGNYDFAKIEWYHKGNLIAGRGEHNSYIYTKDYGQETLEYGSPYWAELTRVDDGKTIRTCNCYPEWQQDTLTFKEDNPQYVSVRYQSTDKHLIYIDTELSGKYDIYHVSGIYISSGYFGDEYDNNNIVLNDCAAGTYIVIFHANNGIVEPKRIIVD